MLMVARVLGPVTLTKLAEMTVTERTTLTRNLTILEKKGLIVIEPGKDRGSAVSIRTGQNFCARYSYESMHYQLGQGDHMDNLLKDLSEIISLSTTGRIFWVIRVYTPWPFPV
jgi:hypothetical protein